MKSITRISIVEDTDHIRKNLQIHINGSKDLFCVSAYDNAEAALIGIPKEQPDIVIMDIGLPKMNGIECMFQLKLNNPKLPFLMYTIFEDDDNVFEALKAGADGYILKEDRASRVLQGIRDFMATGGAPMSASIARKVIQSFHQGPKNKILEQLTAKEKVVLEQIAKGLLNKEIAAKMGITHTAMRVKIHRIYKKLQVNNRIEALNKYNNAMK